MDGYIGEIRMFSFGFAPRGWVECNGTLLTVQQNQALFALLGTAFGGNGTSTFAVPDLRGRVVLSQGNNAGVNFVRGQNSGTQTVTLNTSQLPIHTHNLQASILAPNSIPAGGCMLAATTALQYAPFTGVQLSPMSVGTIPIGPVGAANQPFSIIQPVLGMGFYMATQGVFPSRN